MGHHMDSIPSYYTPKERQLAAMSQLVSHQLYMYQPSQKIILNRLKLLSEEIIAEEQAGLRLERSSTQQIFNVRIFDEEYLKLSRIFTMSS